MTIQSIFCKATSSALLTLSIIHSSHASLIAGDLIISEVMANPAAVTDTNGEWFEIYNASAQAQDLNLLVIRDNGSNQHTVTATEPLFIQAGDYFVFGRNSDSATNGGYQADYEYSNFTLSNSSDQIILEFDNTVIASLFYSESIFATAGKSAELSNGSFSQTPDSYTFGDGDIGTPGVAGSSAPLSPVPIPGAAWLMGTALFGLFAKRKKH